MISFIGDIIIGGLAAMLARFIMPGRDPGGFVVTILLGIVGAVVATFLGHSSAGMGRGSRQGSSARWSARSSSWRSIA